MKKYIVLFASVFVLVVSGLALYKPKEVGNASVPIAEVKPVIPAKPGVNKDEEIDRLLSEIQNKLDKMEKDLKK